MSPPSSVRATVVVRALRPLKAQSPPRWRRPTQSYSIIAYRRYQGIEVPPCTSKSTSVPPFVLIRLVAGIVRDDRRERVPKRCPAHLDSPFFFLRDVFPTRYSHRDDQGEEGHATGPFGPYMGLVGRRTSPCPCGRPDSANSSDVQPPSLCGGRTVRLDAKTTPDARPASEEAGRFVSTPRPAGRPPSL